MRVAHHSFAAGYDRNKPITLKGIATRVEKDSLQAGNEVTVDGWLAKSGAKLANMRTVVLADGRRVLGGSSAGEQQT
jgi:hypothetical protein